MRVRGYGLMRARLKHRHAKGRPLNVAVTAGGARSIRPRPGATSRSPSRLRPGAAFGTLSCWLSDSEPVDRHQRPAARARWRRSNRTVEFRPSADREAQVRLVVILECVEKSQLIVQLGIVVQMPVLILISWPGAGAEDGSYGS
jgi:hypothetical protein